LQLNGVAQNSQRANALFQSAAERGSAEGLVLLANSYLLGQGVQQNIVRARELIWEAATAGHPQAQAVYGGMLLQG
jgi:TPR repeat protein